VLAAYDLCLKLSHAFNLLDARGAISTTERAALIVRIRSLACRTARLYLEQKYGQEEKR
jgi:glycyl-tRNA synthetase alpha chain